MSLERTEVTVATEIQRILKSAGVDIAFGIPGVHNLPFWNTPLEHSPRIINVRHEQTAVYAADGQARSTGKLAVAFTTTGPGAANTLGAFGEAAISRSPVLLISSEAPIKNREPGIYRGYLHEMENQSALFTPLAKKMSDGSVLSASARNAEEALTLVSKFIKAIISPPSGSAYLGIPADILHEKVNVNASQIETSDKCEADVDEVTTLLSNCEKIVLWVGGGSLDFANEIAELADSLAAPIISTFAGRGSGSKSKYYLQLPVHEKEVSNLLASADVLVILGSQFDGMNSKNWSLQLPKQVVVVDCAPEIHTRNLNVTISIKTQLNKAIFEAWSSIPAKKEWIDVATINREGRARIHDSVDGSTGMSLVTSIDASFPTTGQVVCDMCIAGYWYGGYGTARSVRQLSYPVGWGTLGFALPAAIGVATKGAPTLVICGDGGIAFALAELATIVQEHLPITVLIHDDGGYGMLRYDQKVMDLPERGVQLINPDWKLLAQSFGIGFTHSTIADLSQHLSLSASKKVPNIILITESLTPPKTTSPRWREN